MADFDALLTRATDKSNTTVHGAIFKGVDKHGNTTTSHQPAHTSQAH